MDLSRLSTAHKIALAGGVLLLVDSFLNWYEVSAFGFSAGINAWSSGFLAWAGVICGVAAAVILAMKAMGKQDVSAGGKSPEQLAMILGIASFVLIALRLVTETSYMAFGLFVGLAASAMVAYGTWAASKAGAPVGTMSTPTPPAP
jgi:hypothetical protein